jgi:hypothetical protein
VIQPGVTADLRQTCFGVPPIEVAAIVALLPLTFFNWALNLLCKRKPQELARTRWSF